MCWLYMKQDRKAKGVSIQDSMQFFTIIKKIHMNWELPSYSNKTKRHILAFRPVNGRICVLRIKTKFFNLSIMNAHAETEDKEEHAKDSFYQKLEQTYPTT